jgi:hypothetical protein
MNPSEISSSRSTSTSAVLPPSFPDFDWIRIRTPIVANEMTIWPAPKETYLEWAEGFPFELHFFAWDYLWIRCDGYEVEIKPHYLDSTWDTFWTGGTGYVRASALGGLFPWTLGKEVDLLKGIVSTLEALPPLIAATRPDDATKIEHIHGILKTREFRTAIGPDQSQGLSSLRRYAADRIWRRKVKRLLRSRSTYDTPNDSDEAR